MKQLLVLICLLAASLSASAQNWFRTAGPVEDDVFDVCIDSNGVLYAVTPLGVNRSTNGGAHWTRPFLFPARSTTGRITIAVNGAIVVSTDNAIYVSNDRGNSFILRDEDMRGSINQIATTSNGRIVVVHMTKFVYSDDNGTKWKSCSIAGMLEHDEHPVVVGASHDTLITLNQSYMYASFNNGASWKIYHGFFNTQGAKRLLIHPNGLWIRLHMNTLLCSSDSGNWHPLSGAPWIPQFYTADIMRDGSILLSSSRGVYFIKDTSEWIDISEGFINKDTNIAYKATRFIEDPKSGVYYAATTSVGVLRSTPLTQASDDQTKSRVLSISPNPFTDKTVLRFTADVPMWQQVELRNILGAVVWKKSREYSTAVTNTLSITVPGLPPGNYLLVLRTNERTETQWVTIVK